MLNTEPRLIIIIGKTGPVLIFHRNSEGLNDMPEFSSSGTKEFE